MRALLYLAVVAGRFEPVIRGPQGGKADAAGQKLKSRPQNQTINGPPGIPPAGRFAIRMNHKTQISPPGSQPAGRSRPGRRPPPSIRSPDPGAQPPLTPPQSADPSEAGPNARPNGESRIRATIPNQAQTNLAAQGLSLPPSPRGEPEDRPTQTIAIQAPRRRRGHRGRANRRIKPRAAIRNWRVIRISLSAFANS